jgi:hypothetical protein
MDSKARIPPGRFCILESKFIPLGLRKKAWKVTKGLAMESDRLIANSSSQDVIFFSMKKTRHYPLMNQSPAIHPRSS